MTRYVLALSLCGLLGLAACSNTGSNSNNNNNTQIKECETPRQCWKKVCPQSDQTEYDECVHKRVNTQVQDNHPEGKFENHKPEYLTCNAANKCEDIPTDTLGGGKVLVAIKETEKKIPWLRLSIFPTVDLDGKAITCERLKKMASEDPASLMSVELRRYWPARDANQPLTTPVARSGTSLPLLFGQLPVTVPAGSHIVVVQGFCDPKEGGTPGASTPHQWWLCQEDLTFQAGDQNEINVSLDTTQHKSCR